MKEIALEVGPKYLPTIDWLDDRLGSKHGHIYLDLDYSTIKRLAGIHPCENNYLNADACHIPLKSKSIGLIYLRDVFGSIHPQFYYPSYDEYITGFHFQDEIKKTQNIVREFARICKNNALVVVCEMGTPANLEFLVRQFESNNFTKRELYRGQDTTRIFRKQIRNIPINSLGNEYSLVFQKNKSNK